MCRESDLCELESGAPCWLCSSTVLEKSGGVVVVVGERRWCNAGLRSDLVCSALLWRWLALQLAFFEASGEHVFQHVHSSLTCMFQRWRQSRLHVYE